MCFGLLQANTGDYTFANMRAQHLTPFWGSVAFCLAVFGFGAKAGLLPPGDFHEHIGQACSQGILSAEEAEQLREFDATVMALTAVDDFDPAELQSRMQPA